MNEPSREVFWNIDNHYLVYLLLLPVIAVFAYGLYHSCIFWRRSREEKLPLNWQQFISSIIIQRKNLLDPSAGIMHLLMFWGMLVLFVGTAVTALEADFGVKVAKGWFYLVFQSLILDIAGALVIIGVIWGLVRRYIFKIERLKQTKQDLLIGVWLLAILITGYVTEGLRINLTADQWAAWSPVGWVFGRFLFRTGPAWHRAVWWIHLVLAFGLLAYIPFGKLRHMIVAPLSALKYNQPVKGVLSTIDLTDENISLGIKDKTDLTRKDLLDLDACTECGRCEQRCPAFLTGKTLSPRNFIAALRAEACNSDFHEEGSNVDEMVWDCNNCGYCQEQCPVLVEHVEKITGFRRYSIMEQVTGPSGILDLNKSLEDRGHPYRGTSTPRNNWMKSLNLKDVKPGEKVDVLLWVGCSLALNERGNKVITSLAGVLKAAGVSFSVLGSKERCCGDPARRTGNEFLYQEMVANNITTFQKLGISKLVTACPHCYNTLKNEYTQFGFSGEVIHHSEFMAQLLKEEKLKLSPNYDKVFTYHDPCFLGRLNDLYAEPREVLTKLTTGAYRELPWAKSGSFCCGGGGGRVWVDEPVTQRPSILRLQQIESTGAEAVMTTCPLCLTMLEDAGRSQGSKIEFYDLAELAAACLESTQPLQEDLREAK